MVHHSNVHDFLCELLFFNIATKLKQKSELMNDDARLKEEERRKQKDALAKLKSQQRAEVSIYIVGKVMITFIVNSLTSNE